MSLPAHLLLTKALHLLDRGEIGRGEGLLREAVVAAGESADRVTEMAALCCLGEMMIRQDRRTEAVEILRMCLAVPVPEDLLEVCEAEHARARRLLTGLGQPHPSRAVL